MVKQGKDYCSSETNHEAAIALPRKRKANPTNITAVIAGHLQDIIVEFSTTMKEFNHHITFIHVSSLPELLNYSITRTEKSKQPKQVFLLPNALTTQSTIGKSGSLCMKPASATPQYHEKWRMFNLLTEIIHNNVYHEMCITKETKWKLD